MNDLSFLYILFGDSEIHYQEASFSIASLLARNPEAQVIVLSEKLAPFCGIKNVEVVHLTEQMKSAFLQGSTYLFNLKLHGMIHVLENFSSQIIFLDSDTIVLKKIEYKPNDNVCIMHELEGLLSRRRFKRCFSGIFEQQFSAENGHSISIDENTPMYNSGVVGVTKAHIPYLHAAVDIAKKIDSKVEWHTAEQLALGALLNNAGKIINAGNSSIRHYWHKKYKLFIREQVVRFLEHHSINDVIKDPSLVKNVKLHRSPKRWLRDKRSDKIPLSANIEDYKN